ncbi:MAG: two-component sensor histidine kinase [Clostridiales bacterium]|nr:two-component sensor histidine kinase [Clostridiales bacterium]
MKKKINTWMVLTVFVTLVATLFIAVAIFRNMYKEQVLSEMRTCAALISSLSTSPEELSEQYTEDVAGLRVTLIDEDGTVVYDSDVSGTLENHADREEVQEAEADGEGWTTRYSDSLDSELYYYAVKLDDGSILRISKEEASIWGIFTGTLKGIIGVGVIMLLVCMLLSRRITASIVKPIERMADNIDSVGTEGIYEELVPFVMTIRQQHEDILQSANMRQEFTANVSHELKTPLTSISGYAELIETGMAGEKEVRHFAHEIHRSAQRLLTMINDIIRLSQLDSGKLELPHRTDGPAAQDGKDEHRASADSKSGGDAAQNDDDGQKTEAAADIVDLYAAACGCVDGMRLNAKKNGIQISCSGESCMIHGDRNLIEELITNLCDNAIRYNKPNGRVDVIVQEQNGRPMLRVKDTGIGIPKESQERVFERFYCVDKSRSRSTGGTGLGLAIVKHIVALHHAQIELKSEVGEGTEITVWF